MNKNIFIITIIVTLLTLSVSSALTNPGNTLDWITTTTENKTYQPGKEYTFITEWESNSTLKEVNITHNFTGTEVINATLIDGKKSIFTIQNLKASNYEWFMTAKNENETQNTSVQKFTIHKTEPDFNITINKKELYEHENVLLNITLNQNEGELKLFANNELKNVIENELIINETIEPGIYDITLLYEETQNYTSKNITKQINVKEIELEIITDKETYDIGEEGTFLINTLENSTTQTSIFGPGCDGEGFLQEQKNTLEKQGSIHTDKAGIYCIKTELQIEDFLKETEIQYEVKNNIEIRITGNKLIEKNEETSLKVEARNGFSPYTFKWILDDGWKEVEGNELKEKYDEIGEYEVIIQVTDDKGNKKEKTITIEVKNKHAVKVTVTNEDNEKIEDAEVIIGNEYEFTNSNGLAELEVYNGEYELEVIAQNYRRHRQDINVDKNKEIEVQLRKQTTTTSSNSNEEIKIITPKQNEVLTNTRFDFEAEINPSSTAICKIYLARAQDEWFEELESYQVKEKETIKHSHQLETGEYEWRMECSEEDKTYSSGSIKFEIAEASVTTTSSNNLFDAGDIRQKLEDARDELTNINYEDEKAAKALDVHEQIRRALREFDRNMRDINSMAFRRDLTQQEIDKKIQEFISNIEELEKRTPRKIKTIDSKKFVDYPPEEEVYGIANSYVEEKNIEGNLNSQNIFKLQNKIVVTTEVITAEITYLNGEEKDITIINKQIEYKEETERREFLLEKIPSEFNINADEIEMFQSYEVIKRNPLLKLGFEDNITYFFPSHINLEEANKIRTIIMTDSLQSIRTRTSDNALTGRVTGMVTGIQTSVGAPIWSITVLVILMIAVLVHFIDFKSLFGHSIKKEIHKINMLINDSQDYIDAGQTDRANFIFKEVKYNYETSKPKVKKEVHEKAMNLYHEINASFVRNKIVDVKQKINEYTIKEVAEKYNNIIIFYEELEDEAKKKINQEVNDLAMILKQKHPSLFN